MQMIDIKQLALLQLPSQRAIIPDMVLTCRILVQRLQQLDSPQGSLSGSQSQVGVSAMSLSCIALSESICMQGKSLACWHFSGSHLQA